MSAPPVPPLPIRVFACLLALPVLGGAPALAHEEPLVPTVEFTLPTQNASEDAGTILATLQLSATSGVDIFVPFTVTGTGTLTDDFTIDTSPVTIFAGNLTADITIDLVDDALDEADETVVVTLGAPTGADLGGITVHTLTILDQDSPPTVEFAIPRQAVDEAVGSLTIDVILSAPSGLDVWVPFKHFGTADSPADYTIVPSPLFIPAGSTSEPLVVTIIDDTTDESTERFFVRLKKKPTNAQRGTQFRHRVNLRDDDGLVILPDITGLVPSTRNHAFAFTQVGQADGPLSVTLTNQNQIPITFRGVSLKGDHGADFLVSYPSGLPQVLNPGETAIFEVLFAPLENGPRSALASVRQTPSGAPPGRVRLTGLGLGPTGGEVTANAGGQEFVAQAGTFWSDDYGHQGVSQLLSTQDNVLGTLDDQLYGTARTGPAFSYVFQLLDGEYDVVLHAAEIEFTAAGRRVFDVFLEGALVLDDLDLFVTAGANVAWNSDTLRVAVTGGALEVDFSSLVGDALIAGIEVRSVPLVDPDTTLLDFDVVDQGSVLEQVLTLTNTGLHDALANQISFVIDGTSQGSGSDFYVRIGGVDYYGSTSTVFYTITLDLPAGQSVPISVFFEPTEHQDNFLLLDVFGNFDRLRIELRGTGGGNPGWGFLHPVLDRDPALAVDYDGDGREFVNLLGAESHTHEPGQNIAAWEWRVDGNLVSTKVDTRENLPVGDYSIELTIFDDKLTPDSAADDMPVSVYAADRVPGILASYYDGAGGGAVALLDNVPVKAQFIERTTALQTLEEDGKVGGSPFSSEVMVRWQARFDVPTIDTYVFKNFGGTDDRIFVDGSPVTGPLLLTPGLHDLEARFAVVGLSDLPLSMRVVINGVVQSEFDADLVHDENGIVPLISDMPSVGTELGGNLIPIQGFGYYPRKEVKVHWGLVILRPADFVSWTGEQIEIYSPPGTGTIQVTVETPAGTSDPRSFTYSPDGPVPIKFDLLGSKEVPIFGATTALLHPNGKWYVGCLDGRIAEFEFDENWDLVPPGVVWHTGVSNLTNFDLLGIAVNPYDDMSGPVKLYVGHGEHWLNGGGSFQGPSPFTGQVSVLTGPAFDSPVALITGLPTSNHDHGVNGLLFDNNGDLLVCSGGNTNAGVKYPLIGDLPESPFSAAILRAETSDPLFDGNVVYLDRNTSVPVADQVFGESIDPAPGTQIEVYASGLRNAYDLVLTTWGLVYTADNGPNWGFGYASTGPNTDTGTHVETDDEFMLAEYSNYYGHPNRARGSHDPRENVYRDVVEPSTADFTQRLWSVDSSTNGLDEYRAQTFNGQLRGWIIAQKWNSPQYLLELSADHRSVVNEVIITPQAGGLDVVQGPGGSMLAIDYTLDRLQILEPDDISAVALTLHDVHPWRAPSGSGTPFLLGGEAFVAGQTQVTIGGQLATLTNVTPRRIHGVLPILAPNNIGNLYDVEVSVGLDTVTLPEAFLVLPAVPGLMNGFWTTASALPDPLGEVAAGVVDDTLYLVGEGSGKTYAYDLLKDTWLDTLALRPFPGNHHALERFGGKLYLFGGLGGGSEGQVQIYDPLTDSWSVGAPMPWAGGSCSSAEIDGSIYVCGGIVSSNTVTNLSVYDPLADTWDAGGALSPMPIGVNHAASATDGSQFMVFGGRSGPNMPQDGFDVVQIYDPLTDTWDASGQGGSSLTPMPQGRGGTGRAVWFQDEFYVFGGESSSAVFADVFVYDPVANTWRMDESMPTARHGTYPLRFQSRLFVIGGGITFGFSASDVMEIFQRP